MARSTRSPEPPSLFDLPLDLEGSEEGPATLDHGPRARRPTFEPAPAPMQESLLYGEPEEGWDTADFDGAAEESTPARHARPATVPERFRAGLIDLGLHGAVGLAALAGAELLGARPDLSDLPAVGLFLLAFSLFYNAVPLAFWSGTPGMVWVGLDCRAPGDLTLTFGQTFRHWLGSLLTLALAGLPLLLGAGGKRALSDRLAGTATLRELD